MMKKISCLLVFAAALVAEEGMWPFNMIPTAQIEEKYGVALDEAWREHVQRSCLRISLGGSGSFVSSQGLVLTNHHVGSKAIYNLSTKEHDLMEHGFYAKSFDEELKCPNMYVDELVSIQDVTAEVNGAMTESMSGAEREAAKTSAMAKIKKEAQEKSGLQPQIVTLYQGARYHLYLYKRYTDIRLVMAPEKGIAFFGGDNDNFEYPRYDLDICFFRVYENEKPLVRTHFLPWSPSGPQRTEPLFVAGHPGSTQRLLTSSHLSFVANYELPLYLKLLGTKKKALEAFGAKNIENERIASAALFSLSNSYKVFRGIERGFATENLVEKKKESEVVLYGNPKQFPAWEALRVALDEAKGYYNSYVMLEGFGSRLSPLYTLAKNLVRLSVERNKPDGVRLKEYVSTEIPTLELFLFSTEPIYRDLERSQLASGLLLMQEVLGTAHPAVQKALAGKTAAERAEELAETTQLTNIDYRRQLYDHPEEVATSQDPLIALARELDPYARAVRKREEEEFESVKEKSYAAIAHKLFERFGESLYPDATFTLRLSIGTMRGYQENGVLIPPETTIAGTFAHAEKHSPAENYTLPRSWTAKGEMLKQNRAAFNFVSTNDIIGGNSGSPVVNSKGEFVGLIFDGNKQSLTWNYEFSEVQGRAISVHSLGIIEILRNVYHAEALVHELENR